MKAELLNQIADFFTNLYEDELSEMTSDCINEWWNCNWSNWTEETNEEIYAKVEITIWRKIDEILSSSESQNYTYDIVFNDDTDSNNVGGNYTLQEAKDYIEMNNGTDWGYFKDYKGGTVSIYCKETDEEVYSETVR